MKAELAMQAANELGEGIVWSQFYSEVFWTDIIGKTFWRFDPATQLGRPYKLDERLANFAMLPDNTMIAGFASGLAHYNLQTSERTPIAMIEADLPTTRLNDAKLDRQGRLVFGTMDESAGGPEPIGQVWSYDGQAVPRVLFGGVRISNSIAFSPDGRLMYFADTPNRRIDVFDYDPITGTPFNRRVFADCNEAAGYPDGSTIDSEGCLWNAEWGGSRVVRYTPEGEVDQIIDVPAPFVTCCSFGGRDLKTLYITTARVGMGQSDLQAAPLSGSLFAVELDVAGLIDTQFNFVI